MSGFEITTVRPTKAGVRVWFKCPTCGGYGDTSTGSLDDAEWAIRCLNDTHTFTCKDGA